MSRFYIASSSESESGSDSSDSDVQVVPKKTVTKFVESSDEEVEVKRVVRSAKDKLWEQLDKNLKDIKSHVATNDWALIQADYEAMTKAVDKSSALIQKDGMPQSFIKGLYLIEAALPLDESIKKKLSQKNSKSHTFLRQKVKKSVQTYETHVKVYRENPALVNDNAAADDSDSDSDSEEEVKPKKPVAAVAKKPAASSFMKKGDDESDFSSYNSDSESESDSDYDSSDGDKGSRWMLDKTKPGKIKPEGPGKIRVNDTDKIAKRDLQKTQATPVGEQTAEPKQLTTEEIQKKLKEVLNNRGKKGTNTAKQISELENLLVQSKTPKETFDILYNLINAQFDLSPTIQTALPVAIWKSASDNIIKLIDFLQVNKHFVLTLEHEEPLLEQGQVMVRGNLLSLFERLDDEFTKSLQHMTFPSQPYTDRLADEPSLLAIGERVQDHLESLASNDKAARAAIRRLEHLYYRNDSEGASNDALIKRLSAFVYQHGDERLNARTILCNIYYNAIQNRFHEARDMMLMSHLQDNPTLMDVLTQILFNRSMVQLGLCAFRNGYIQEAQQCLAEFSGLRKELLAQGPSIHPKYQEKDALKEIEEKQRMLPGHMHIPIDLIETINLVSGMMIAVPQNAARPFDSKPKTCKFYQRHMDHLDKQVFVPPPEGFKDVIYASSKALATGDYTTTIELLSGLKIWTVLADGEAVRARLNRIVQEVSLKTFLFTYSVYYDTMLLSELSERFQLPKNHVHSIVSKMMANHEISASWEHSTETITFHRSEQTKLQYLALHYSDSLIQFVDQNERIYDTKFGSYRNKKFGDDMTGPNAGNPSHQNHHQNNQNNTHRKPYQQRNNQNNNNNYQNRQRQ
eukprot:gene15765-18737_t